MFSQWKLVAFWLGAILVMVLATVFYQPAAAKTGSLLVWTRNRVYVMDIDTLTLNRVAPAAPGEVIAPSPGCYGQIDTLCWVVVSNTIYFVDLGAASDHKPVAQLPIGTGFQWDNASPVSWSPDGVHVAYTVIDRQLNQAELRIFDVVTQQVKVTANNVDPTVAVAWTSSCGNSFDSANCEIAYKQMPEAGTDEPPTLIGLTPALDKERQWPVSADPIFELRWTPAGTLLYSQPKRHFKHAEDHTPAYDIPSGSRLANMSTNTALTVYYQPFTLSDCESPEADGCLHLGVWLTSDQGNDDRTLVYSVDVSNAEEVAGGLNFIPTWSPQNNAFVFFQEGQLVHYDIEAEEATIWYKPIRGKLRTVPVFSPNEEAVAFVDNEGQGFSEYRLVVVDPKLQPVEHIIQTDSGFKILAWLPN